MGKSEESCFSPMLFHDPNDMKICLNLHLSNVYVKDSFESLGLCCPLGFISGVDKSFPIITSCHGFTFY